MFWRRGLIEWVTTGIALLSCGGGPQFASPETSLGVTEADPEGRGDADLDEDDDAATQAEAMTGSGQESGSPPDLPEDCGGETFIFNAPQSRHIWVVDNSLGTTVPFDHDGDPQTPDRSAGQNIAEFMEWILPLYPPNNGCLSVAPAIMFYPGAGAAMPPSEQSCEVEPPELPAGFSSQGLVELAWEERPAPSGSAAVTQALVVAVQEGLGGFEFWDENRIVLVAGSPPSCGPGSEDEDPSLGQLASTLYDQYGITTYFVNAGPETGILGDEIDGRPDGVDVAQSWAQLEWTWDFEVYSAQAGAQLLAQLSAPVQDPVCYFDLSTEPHMPPDETYLVPTLLINDEPFHELNITWEDCAASDAPSGFVWLNELRAEFLLCGDACAAMHCENSPPYPDNGLRVELPYLCGD